MVSLYFGQYVDTGKKFQGVTLQWTSILFREAGEYNFTLAREQVHFVCYLHEYLGSEAPICQPVSEASRRGEWGEEKMTFFPRPILLTGSQCQDTRANNTLTDSARCLYERSLHSTLLNATLRNWS